MVVVAVVVRRRSEWAGMRRLVRVVGMYIIYTSSREVARGHASWKGLVLSTRAAFPHRTEQCEARIAPAARGAQAHASLQHEEWLALRTRDERTRFI